MTISKYKYTSNIFHDNKGAALMIAVLFFLFISIAVVLGAVGPFVREIDGAQDLIKSKSSYYIAEAGNEDVIYRLKNGMQTSASEIVVLDDLTTSVDIIDVGSNGKEIISNGSVDSNIRIIKTEISTTVSGVSFFYGAQVGEGGVEMEQNSRIEGAGGTPGNVYSNGPIVGANGATITGDATVATAVAEDVQARSTVCNEDNTVGQSDPNIDYAQSFSPGSTGSLAKISIYVKKVGNPSSREIKIVTDNSGSPNSSEIESGTLNKDLVGNEYSWVDVVFSTPPTLTAGQTYWIVLDANSNSNNYWVWCSDSNNGFGNGVAKYSEEWDDDPWTQITGDLTFKTYTGGGISSIKDMRIEGTARANTILDSFIVGDAYYQTITNTTVNGTQYPGSPDPAVLNMPLSDANIAQFKSDAEAGGTIVGDCGDSGDPSCIINVDDTLSLGPTKITGNLNLSGRQTLVVTGTLYVVGNIDISGTNVNIRCDASFNENSCLIITDGWVHISNNATFSGSGQPDSYLMITTVLEGCRGSGGTGCTDHYSAVDLLNNATGAIFYASDSMIYLHNNVNITSAVGYKLKLENGATITYETGAQDAGFSSGPGGSWKVNSWEETQ